jgi:hypothetical protein
MPVSAAVADELAVSIGLSVRKRVLTLLAEQRPVRVSLGPGVPNSGRMSA